MKVYKWVCGCKKSPLNNLFPNGENTTLHPPIMFKGKCKICGCDCELKEVENGT